MKERKLSPQELDMMQTAATVVRQADGCPTHIVNEQADILDLYLTKFPVQSHQIINFFADEQGNS